MVPLGFVHITFQKKEQLISKRLDTHKRRNVRCDRTARFPSRPSFSQGWLEPNGLAKGDKTPVDGMRRLLQTSGNQGQGCFCTTEMCCLISLVTVSASHPQLDSQSGRLFLLRLASKIRNTDDKSIVRNPPAPGLRPLLRKKRG